MLNVSLDADALRPVIEAAVAETLARLRDDEAQVGERMAFDEPTAAGLLSLEPHQLQDERLRGRITASTIVGRRIRDLREDLLAYLGRNRGKNLKWKKPNASRWRLSAKGFGEVARW